MKLKNSVKSAMEKLGLKTLRKHQNGPIDSLLNGKDTLVIYPTSSGKSAIFQIPALVNAQHKKWTLVIEPTISLIHDQVKRLNTSLVKQQENPSIQSWLEKRLEEMIDIAQSEKCLTKELLHTLGEEKPKPCGRCTNCQRNRRMLG